MTTSENIQRAKRMHQASTNRASFVEMMHICNKAGVTLTVTPSHASVSKLPRPDEPGLKWSARFDFEGGEILSETRMAAILWLLLRQYFVAHEQGVAV